MKILVAEDETDLAEAISKILEKNNFSTDVVHDGEDALYYLEMGEYDAAVLDIMMPKMDGLTVLRRIRKKGSALPVVMLTAKATVEDKVDGLDSGASYYLTKPFEARELLAVLRTVTRREASPAPTLSAGNLTLNQVTYEISTEHGTARLTNKEFQMLELFMNNRGRYITAETLLDKVWGYDTDADINVVWVYLSYIRKKLTSLQANVQIKAARNQGYFLEVGK